MVSTPRLDTLLGKGKALRETVELLIYIDNLYLVTEALGIEYLSKILGKRVANNKYHLAETGTNSVVDRVVDDSLAIGAYAIHLLE